MRFTWTNFLIGLCCALWVGAAAAEDPPAPVAAPAVQVDFQFIAAPVVQGPEKPAAAADAAADGKDGNLNPAQQEIANRLKPVLKSELSFAGRVCKLDDKQRKALSKAGDECVKKTATQFGAPQGANQQIVMRGGGRAVMVFGGGGVWPTDKSARQILQEGLAESLKTDKFPPETAAIYARELAKRSDAQKETVIEFLVVMLDRRLILSTQQRVEIGQALKDHFDESWAGQLPTLLNNPQYFPVIPDECLLPKLRESQRTVWQNLPNRNVQFGFDAFDTDPMANLGIQVPELDDAPQGVAMKTAGYKSKNWLWLALVLFACAIQPALAWGAANDDDDDDAAVPQQGANQQMFVMTPETFDQWVFNGVGNSAQAMKQLQSQLDMQLEAMDRVCTLSAAQKEKLKLAGSSDIKKFRDQFEQIKRKFQNTRQNQNDMNNVFQAIAPLQTQWQAGLLGENSLFNRVIKNTLTPEQWTSYEQDANERSKYQYKAKIKLAIAALQGSVALSDEQRQKFEKLLLDKTKPPKKYSQPQYDFYVVMIEASKIPEKELKTIFDDAQMKAMQRVYQQTKGMEQMLKQEGVFAE